MLWRNGGHGAFYSSPAVAYGRVFLGSLDDGVYAFGEKTGDLLWSRPTGGYVYASPAVAERLVLIGSYDHRFYALDAGNRRGPMDDRGERANLGCSERDRRRRLVLDVRRANLSCPGRQWRRVAAVAWMARLTGGGRRTSRLSHRPRPRVRAHGALRYAQRFAIIVRTPGQSAEPPKFITPAENTFAPPRVS